MLSGPYYASEPISRVAGLGVNYGCRMSDVVTSLDQLHALYAEPVEASVRKVTNRLISSQAAYVKASPFAILATNGPEGVDCSPRGDGPGFVRIASPTMLHLPDRRGNNRLDSLRNIVRDPTVALLFLVPGIGTTLRVNGHAVLRTDETLCRSFAFENKVPALVIEVAIDEVYTQCPKALIRSGLWDPSRFLDASALPSAGTMMTEITDGDFDGAAYDAAYPARLQETLY